MIKNGKGNKKSAIQKTFVVSLIFTFLCQISLQNLFAADQVQPTVTATTTSAPQSTFQIFTPFKPYQPTTTIGTTTTTITPTNTSTTSTTSQTVVQTVVTTNPTGQASPVVADVNGVSPTTDTSFLQATSPLSQPTNAGSSSTPDSSSTTQTIGPVGVWVSSDPIPSIASSPTSQATNPILSNPTTTQNPFVPIQPVTTTPPPATGGSTTKITPISNPSDTNTSSNPSTITDIDQTTTVSDTPQSPSSTINPPSNTGTPNTSTTSPPTSTTTTPPVATTNNSGNNTSTGGGNPDPSDVLVSPKSNNPANPTTPTNSNTTPPLISQPFQPSSTGSSSGGGSSSPFVDAKRTDNPYVAKGDFAEKDFVGGAVGAGLGFLTMWFKDNKGKNKAEFNKDVSQTEKIQSEGETDESETSTLNQTEKNEEQKKNKKTRKLLKKLRLNREQKTQEEQNEEQVLKQSGAIETDLSDLEHDKQVVESSAHDIPNNPKQSPLGFDVVSDLSPVHQIQSKTLPSNFNPSIKPQEVHPPAKKQHSMKMIIRSLNPAQLFQTAKVMSPATIFYSIHQIATPDESGTRIQKSDSNLEDIDS